VSHRRRAWDDGAWVREAALAFAENQNAEAADRRTAPRATRPTAPIPPRRRLDTTTRRGGSEMTETNPGSASASATRGEWPLYEVFVRGKRGLNHVHVGSLHATDDQMAIHHARDVYTRRNEGVSIWVVRSADVTASSPDEKDPMFAPSGDKVYRHPDLLRHPRRCPPHVRRGDE
jgi:ring-1,2-phenylacetyl-CoA epoxidase subunit PaaB